MLVKAKRAIIISLFALILVAASAIAFGQGNISQDQLNAQNCPSGLCPGSCTETCGGQTYYCINYAGYGGWKWATSQPACGISNNCDSAVFCADTVRCYAALGRWAYAFEAPSETCNSIDDNCNGQVDEGCNPVCSLSWDSPTTAGGKGARKIGDSSRVAITLSGLLPNQRFILRNTHTSGYYVQDSGHNADTDGSYYTYDSTQITDSEYGSHLGEYATYAIDENNRVLSACGGFVLASAVQPSCSLAWDPPTMQDGMGFRRIGETDSVKISVGGLAPNQQFFLKNVHSSGYSVQDSGHFTGSDGSFFVYDHALVAQNEYGSHPGDYSTKLLDSNGNVIADCGGFRIAGPPTCSLSWDSPILYDGRGLRYAGNLSNVKINVSGLGPGQNFILRNVHTSGYYVQDAGHTADNSGSFSIYDHTLVTQNDYGNHPGNYTIYAIDQSGQILTACGGFVIGSACGNGIVEAGENCDENSPCCISCHFASSTTQCDFAIGSCESDAYCTGSLASCPAKTLKSSTVLCSPARGTCENDAYCTGSSSSCPANTKKPFGTVCNFASGTCENSATCDGNSASCPTNTFKPSTAMCRPSANLTCDVAEYCTGSSAFCPADSNTCGICGNGVVEQPEQCEVPNTNNSNYCSQTTTACEQGGKRLGTRDAYGYCGLACGCIQDPFVYNCATGQCGATCDAHTQCAASTCSQMFSDYCSGNKLYEYNNNNILDNTTATNSTQNTCDINTCGCTNNTAACPAPQATNHCVTGVCNAKCGNSSNFLLNSSTCYFGCDSQNSCLYTNNCSVAPYCGGPLNNTYFHSGQCLAQGCSFSGQACGDLDYYENVTQYCSGDEIKSQQLFHNYFCAANGCNDTHQLVNGTLVLNCNDLDGWYNTSQKRFVNDTQCTEKEQMEQEYRNYTCGSGPACSYIAGNKKWVDTRAIRNRAAGTQCDNGIFCDGADACNGQGACANTGPMMVCNDGNACTNDFCNEASKSCQFVSANANQTNATLNTIKAYGSPFYSNGTIEWVNSSTLITMTASKGSACFSNTTTFYRITKVDGKNCYDNNLCQAINGSGPWINYSKPFSINEESCHLVEFYSSFDGNSEQIKKQCAIVDNTAPLGNKTVSEPEEKWSGQDSSFYDIKERCWNATNGMECWKVTTMTAINLDCIDSQLSAGNRKVCFNVGFDGDDNTVKYCNEFSGQMNQSYCCLNRQVPINFYFREESEHQLKFYCKDDLGNAGLIDDEMFKVG